MENLVFVAGFDKRKNNKDEWRSNEERLQQVRLNKFSICEWIILTVMEI